MTRFSFLKPVIAFFYLCSANFISEANAQPGSVLSLPSDELISLPAGNNLKGIINTVENSNLGNSFQLLISGSQEVSDDIFVNGHHLRGSVDGSMTGIYVLQAKQYLQALLQWNHKFSNLAVGVASLQVVSLKPVFTLFSWLSHQKADVVMGELPTDVVPVNRSMWHLCDQKNNIYCLKHPVLPNGEVNEATSHTFPEFHEIKVDQDIANEKEIVVITFNGGSLSHLTIGCGVEVRSLKQPVEMGVSHIRKCTGSQNSNTRTSQKRTIGQSGYGTSGSVNRGLHTISQAGGSSGSGDDDGEKPSNRPVVMRKAHYDEKHPVRGRNLGKIARNSVKLLRSKDKVKEAGFFIYGTNLKGHNIDETKNQPDMGMPDFLKLDKIQEEDE
ncbi:hypothetical protein [Endozoicomonas lisbonensis]|uniref:Uncharacterized protein n=1 Tax=Endozoicomonas lisbonensis TaxID=3120522 RepID=A0ABV2SNE3_9GAMM